MARTDAASCISATCIGRCHSSLPVLHVQCIVLHACTHVYAVPLWKNPLLSCQRQPSPSSCCALNQRVNTRTMPPRRCAPAPSTHASPPPAAHGAALLNDLRSSCLKAGSQRMMPPAALSSSRRAKLLRFDKYRILVSPALVLAFHLSRGRGFEGCIGGAAHTTPLPTAACRSATHHLPHALARLFKRQERGDSERAA